jgi:hypothetical protein
MLQEAGYLEVSKSGMGRLSHTVCRLTHKGKEALLAYEQGLRRLFTSSVPAQEEKQKAS